ncbi:teichuronic acid biosynthesis protein TuaG [Heyndrickxia ginsengihumi]|uniref:teichuronic acid biosynthesis protein TuaG n=1 Tax=Heyndrickxia ginsengihumi TaxID=363870 RepID=UPI000470A69A|nr:glycosyltransferase family 2 protein [Heyndrickxia ginsengihumi]
MIQEHPLVTVITPSYNSSKTIKNAVRSVQQQTFRNWEMIIVDDCSNDDTRELLEAIEQSDERIRVHCLQENGGAAIARNIGLHQAKGRYVAFLDSDDCWKPEKLEKQLEFMQKNHYAFTFTSYELIDKDGTYLKKVVPAPRTITYNYLLKNTIVGTLTVMIDLEQVGAVQMPNIRTRQDFATWLAILKQGFVAYGLNEVLAEYRVGSEHSISKNKWKAARQNWFVYRQIEKLNWMKASWCFCHYAANAVLKRI